MKYTWDPKKAASNIKAHEGVTFEEAQTVCENELSVWTADWEHGEARLNVIGYSDQGRVLFVVTVEWEEDELRIISARKAEKHERKKYEGR